MNPDDYNRHGMLRLPLWFWTILILQARTWLLFVMAGASRQQGTDLLKLFYPDTHSFWHGIILGLPPALIFLLCGRRHLWPRTWQGGYWLLLAGMFVTFALQGLSLWQSSDMPSLIDLVLALLDAVALAYWLLSRRLRACFDTEQRLAES
ncbi:DUF2919 domain-containing protein [Ewingella americana]|jgi:hypothetical protein|uniref:DUF2919 domain-containing protein n=1 Tax=Ewingella americana TaxID=41202 RepID=A0A502GND2_9GAMM|nr:DUF2919 domain-containing protein [Ewingella americana]TPG63285.1 DUF2919 domain-containing protein [Ewingella americana]